MVAQGTVLRAMEFRCSNMINDMEMIYQRYGNPNILHCTKPLGVYVL